jgi:PmbA protein
VKPGRSKLENLISEIRKGLIINRFSGNVNPVNGDFSGVIKGGQYVRNGSIKFAIKEVMVSGNVFDALYRITGISKERKLLQDSLLPSIRIDNVSFTAG